MVTPSPPSPWRPGLVRRTRPWERKKSRTARLSVEHDHANILVLAGRPYSRERVRRIVIVLVDGTEAGLRQAMVEIANFLKEKGKSAGEEKVAEMVRAREMGKKTGEMLKNAMRLAQSMMDVTDAISYLGPIGERLGGAAGIGLIEAFGLDLSPMETAFVMVGEPFTWEVENMIPDSPNPGDVITLVGKHFDYRNKDNNEVWLTDTDAHPLVEGGQKLEVISVNSDGTELKVKLPLDVYGGKTLWLRTPYCWVDKARGIHINRKPILLELNPPVGFAGKTTVEIIGKNILERDKALFGDTQANLWEEKPDRIFVKVPDIPPGEVNVIIRADVESDPLVFKVLGPPVINSINPSGVKVGGLVEIRGDNFGMKKDETPLWVKVWKEGNTPVTARIVSIENNKLAFRMPEAGEEGDTVNVKVRTPAGESNVVTVKIIPGVEYEEADEDGYTIKVNSSEGDINPDGKLTLDEAIAFITGEEDPFSKKWDDVDKEVTIKYEQNEEGRWVIVSQTTKDLEKRGGPGHEYRYVKKIFVYPNGKKREENSRVDLDSGESPDTMPEEGDFVEGEREGEDGNIYRDIINIVVDEATALYPVVLGTMDELRGSLSKVECEEGIKIEGDKAVIDVEELVAPTISIKGNGNTLEASSIKAKGEGKLFINTFGAIDKHELKPGETLVVDNFHLAALSTTCRYKVRMFGGLKSTLLGGEGLVTDVTGPGEVYIQTKNPLEFVNWLWKYLGPRIQGAANRGSRRIFF